MSKLTLRTAFLGLLLASLAALPAMAQVIPADKDPWVTPANGQTRFTFADGDVESLCGLAPDPSWDHTVALQGVPVPGSDYDTVVARLDDAVFSNGVATTRIQVVGLSFRSINPTATPCGLLDWKVGLFGPQAVTKMTINRTTRTGGTFCADIAVNAELQAFDLNGKYVGSVFANVVLPQSAATGCTPWSFDPTTGRFRPGISDTNNCIAALRKKLATYPTNSSHYYYISNLIAKGLCKEQ
jgi:hypothetical protein